MTKNKELLLTIQTLANEKGIKIDNAVEAFCQSITTSVKRRIDKEANIQTSLDMKNGTYEISRSYQIVDDNFEGFDDSINVYEDQAEEKVESNPETYSINKNELIEQLSSEARRVDFQVVRQVLMQKINEMAKKEVNESDLVNKVYNVRVRSIEKRGYVVDFKGDTEGFLPRSELVGKEYFKVGAMAPALLMQDEKYTNKTFVFTRQGERFLKELVAQEVEDVANGSVVINSAYSTQDSHYIAVSAIDAYTDPVRSCLGHNGFKKNIIYKSAGYKKVNFIRWSESPLDLVFSLIDEEQIEAAYVDEQLGVITLITENGEVDDPEALEIANGLIKGWVVKSSTQSSYEEVSSIRDQYYAQVFMDTINVDDYVAELLVVNGFTSIDELAYVSKNELLEIPEFSVDGAEEVIDEIQRAAKEKLSAIESEVEGLEIKSLKTVDTYFAHKLFLCNIKTLEDVAEMCVDEVNDIISQYPYSSELIMEARKDLGWV